MQIANWLQSRETPGTLADVARRTLEKDAKYRDIEKTLQGMYVLEALMKHEGHIGRAAEAMGLNRETVRRVLRTLGLTVKDVRRAAKHMGSRDANHAA